MTQRRIEGLTNNRYASKEEQENKMNKWTFQHLGSDTETNISWAEISQEGKQAFKVEIQKLGEQIASILGSWPTSMKYQSQLSSIWFSAPPGIAVYFLPSKHTQLAAHL